MNFSFIRQLTHFTKSQRLGILSLGLFVIAFQCIYFSEILAPKPIPISPEVKQWLTDQADHDTLVQQSENYIIYPFNPNFLNAYKAYKWGISGKQFERLQQFRKQNKYVNSVADFQRVTQVSDSVLQKMAPYFKFPAWVTQKKSRNDAFETLPKKQPILKKDLNRATVEDFIAIRGIGPVLAERIITYRAQLGAFVALEQLDEVYGLNPEVLQALQLHFEIQTPPELVKIKINEATIKALGQFPYFRYPVSRNIVAYRSMNGAITQDKLTNVKGINLDKIRIIALYLEF